MPPRPAAPQSPAPAYLVFRDGHLIAEGPEAAVRPHLVDGLTLVFDHDSGEQVDLPLRPAVVAGPGEPPTDPCAADAPDRGDAAGEPATGSGPSGAESPLRAAGRPAAVPARPGRPRLGVVAREVTLLPGDWAWLAAQPGGASVTLRRLVLAARRAGAGADRARAAQAGCYRFISVLAGNAPGFEEAARALFAGDGARFEACIAEWPGDVRRHAMRLAAPAFGAAQATAA